MKTMRFGCWMAVLAAAATAASAVTRDGAMQGAAPKPPRCGSVLTTVSYDAKGHSMTVVFANGYAYEYTAVPKSVFEGLSAAKSRGRFFTENIRGKFDFHRVQAPPAVPTPVKAEPATTATKGGRRTPIMAD